MVGLTLLRGAWLLGSGSDQIAGHGHPGRVISDSLTLVSDFAIGDV